MSVTLTDEKYEDLVLENKIQASYTYAYSQALEALKKVCREVIEHRDDEPDDLQGWITELEESIPCDDCVAAPCRCPG